MGDKRNNPQTDFLPGTLEMLILKTLSRGTNHGWGIAQHIQHVSDDALKIGEGSLYPALQRLLLNDFVEAEWGVSENNRRAKYYRLTTLGRQRMRDEVASWNRVVEAMATALRATSQEI